MAVGVGEGVRVAVGDVVGVVVRVGVTVRVGVGEEVGVVVRVGVAESVGVRVAVDVGVGGVAVGVTPVSISKLTCKPQSWGERS